MSDLLPPSDPRDPATPSSPLLIEALPAKSAELGGITIRRALPTRKRRLIGPWCFLDRFGPLTFAEGKPMDVAPHPHIGLQTVSWLLEGEIIHNDSLGCEGLVRPGELNLMTAGRGIAHTEETPASNSGRLSGLQLWIALPDAHRDTAPSFHHHAELPTFDLPGGRATLLMGELNGHRAQSLTFSKMTGADILVDAHAELSAPLDATFEHGVLLIEGDAKLEDQQLQPDTLYYLGPGRNELSFRSGGGARVMLIGGPPFGESILIWWNFVARTNEEIEAARTDWQEHRRFPDVMAYRGERLSAPSFLPRLR